MLTTFLNGVIEYFRHDSTWVGLIGIATASGIHFEPEQASAITAAGLACFGLFQVFIVDRNITK